MDSSIGANAMFSSTLPFVGRGQELGALQYLLRIAIDGRGRLALISGEAGIGKTSLVRQLRTMAAETDALVLTGAAYDLTSTPPYGPWLDLIREYPQSDDVPPLPEFISSEDGLAGLGSQAHLHHGLLEFIRQIGQVRPVVLIFEDLHWSDQPSLELLRFIGRSIEHQPILLVATWRDDEISRQHPLYQLLPALVRESNAERLELRQLEETHLDELVQARFALADSERHQLVCYLARLGEGNPLFTLELLRTLERQGDLQQENGGWRIVNLTDERVPVLIQQMIERRTSEVSAETLAALQVAAILGQSVTLDRWERVAEGSATEAAEEAIEAHLIEETERGWEVAFPHALIRQAIYSTIPLPARRDLHARIAEMYLAETNPDPEVLAWHLKQARDPRAAGWLIRAGEQAGRRFASHEAFVRFSDALEALDAAPGNDATRAILLVRTGRSLQLIDPARSNEFLQTAFETAERAGDQAIAAIALFSHGHNLLNLGEVKRGLSYTQHALAMMREMPDEVAEIQPWSHNQLGSIHPLYALNGSLALMLAATGRFRGSVSTAESLIDFDWRELAKPGESARDVRSDYLGHVSLYGLGVALGALGQPEDSKLAFSLAEGLLTARNFRPPRVFGASNELLNYHFPYDTDNLAERARLASLIQEHALISQELHDNALYGYERYLLHTGRWDQLRTLFEKYEPSHMFDLWFTSLSARARFAWYEGDNERARTIIAEILKDGPQTPPEEQAFYVPAEPHRVAAGIAINESDIDLAREWMTAHDHWLDWSEAVQGRAEGLLLWARIYLAENDIEKAHELAEQARQQAEDPRQPMALIAIHRFLGELATHSGDLDVADEHLGESRELVEACDLPYERALTLLAQAELEVQRDDQDNARSLLAYSRRIATDLDARPVIDRADRLIAKLSQRSADDPFGLSARELEVLRVLAEGKSNPEIADELFIARSTVMNHVASILRKLDVDSRSAAAAEAVRRQLV